MRFTIGRKITAWFLLIVLLMVSLTVYSTYVSSKYMKEAIGEGSAVSADEMLNRIERRIYAFLEELDTHSKHEYFVDAVSASNAKFDDMENTREYIRRVDRQWASAPEGEVPSSMRRLMNSGFSKSLRRELVEGYEERYGYTIFAKVIVTNKFGASVAQTGRTANYMQGDEDWWHAARYEGFHIGGIEFDEALGMECISIAVRIEDADGNFIGVTRALLSLKGIVREAELASGLGTTDIRLITGDGRLMYSSEVYSFLEDVSGEDYYGKIQARQGYFMIENGAPRLVSYARSRGVRDYPGLGWVLLVGHEVDKILKPSHVLMRRIYLASAILIAVGVAVAFYASRRITEPLSKLIEGTRRIGSGELDYAVEVAAGDEIGELAVAFNRMAENLKRVTASRDDLNREIAERRRAEAAALASEKKYRDLYDNSPDMYVSVDPDTAVILQCNRTVAAVTGYSREEIIGKRILDMYHPDCMEDARTALEEFVKTGQVTDRELQLRKKDGSKLDVSLNVSSYKDDSGNIIHSRLSWRDITDRKRAEEKLLQSKKTLQRILDSMPFGVFIVGKDRKVRYINQAAVSLSKYASADQVVGKVCGDVVCPKGECVRPILDEKGIVDTSERMLMAADGTTVPILKSVVPMEMEDEEVYLEAFVDIAERMKAEEALRKSRASLAEAQRMASVGNWEWDIVNNKLHWSDEVYNIFGMDPGRFVASQEAFLEVVHPEDRKGVKKSVVRAIRNREHFGMDHRIVLPDGTERIVHEQGEVTFGADGRAVRMIGTIQDITARKKAEEEIRKINEELEQRVAERTAQLEAANRELESFAYSVSHDLRAPLRGIDGFSLALLEDYKDKLDRKGRDYLRRVRRGTQQMGQLIDDILELSRITRSEMNFGTVDLSAIASEIAEEHKRREPERNVEFVIFDKVLVRGDDKLLRVALENLIGNAWKFTSRQPRARIMFGARETSSGRELFVCDDGAGFDMAFVDKLFTPFQRLHAAREFPGTGVGLASVKRIISRHGGRVWAEAAVNEGATFYFTLPDRS